METLTRHQKKDIRLIAKFLEVYCADKHGDSQRVAMTLPTGLGNRRFCAECIEFMKYAVVRRIKCPLEAEKPSCKRCRIHCYAPVQREKIREIMSYSGRKLIMRGRLDYLWHYVS